MARGYPDFEGDKSGLYLKPEWAAKEGIDKDFSGIATNQIREGAVTVLYTVPSGTTLYLTSLDFASYSYNAADGDNNQIGLGAIYDYTTAVWRLALGGNGGNSVTLPKPIVLPAETQVGFIVYNYSNHNCTLRVHASGYEV